MRDEVPQQIFPQRAQGGVPQFQGAVPDDGPGAFRRPGQLVESLAPGRDAGREQPLHLFQKRADQVHKADPFFLRLVRISARRTAAAAGGEATPAARRLLLHQIQLVDAQHRAGHRFGGGFGAFGQGLLAFGGVLAAFGQRIRRGRPVAKQQPVHPLADFAQPFGKARQHLPQPTQLPLHHLQQLPGAGCGPVLRGLHLLPGQPQRGGLVQPQLAVIRRQLHHGAAGVPLGLLCVAHQQVQPGRFRFHLSPSYYTKFGQESRAASPAFSPSRA